jgi:hypothetical protein
MKTQILGAMAIASVAAAALLFITSPEAEATFRHEQVPALQEASIPYHRYKLQYSYNGKTWNDLITIENGELSKNMNYLRRGNRFPSLRYFYTYIDGKGERQAVCIPLTVENPLPETAGRHA